MRLLKFLAVLTSSLLVACESPDGSEEAGQSEIPVIEVSADSYETLAQFHDDAFLVDGSRGGAKIAINSKTTSEIFVIHRIMGCGEDPEVALTIYPCMGGYCMDESWPATRGSELHHGVKSESQMVAAIRKCVGSARAASESPAFCIFYDSETDWEPVFKVLYTMFSEGVDLVTFEELPNNEHQLSEGIERKIDSMKNGSLAPEVFQFDTKD